MTDRVELRALTSVRGVAAWLVLFYHIRLSLDWVSSGVLRVLDRGYLAVDFFFLLSGFVIWMTWGQRLRSEGWSAVGPFLRKRFARVWPLHGVMLGFGVALALLLVLTGRTDNGQFPASELPLHLLLVQNWGLTPGLHWNVPAWSISAELAAYLLFPILALSIDWRTMPTPAIVAAIVAFLVTLASIYAAIDATTLDHDITRYGAARCTCEFAAGTGVAALWLRWRDRPLWPALAAAIVAAVVSSVTIVGLVPEIMGAPPAFAAALLALALTAQARGNPLNVAPLHFLGEVSYATYLNHYLLWFAFKLAFVSDADAVPPPTIGAFCAMIVVVSAMQYYWIERPAQRVINRWRRSPEIVIPAKAGIHSR